MSPNWPGSRHPEHHQLFFSRDYSNRQASANNLSKMQYLLFMPNNAGHRQDASEPVITSSKIRTVPDCSCDLTHILLKISMGWKSGRLFVRVQPIQHAMFMRSFFDYVKIRQCHNRGSAYICTASA